MKGEQFCVLCSEFCVLCSEFCLNVSSLVSVRPPGESESVVRLRPHQSQLPHTGAGAHHHVRRRTPTAEDEDKHDDNDDY